MVWTLILNGSTGLIMVVTFAFCVGNIDEVIASQTGFAFIQVFLNATGSVRAATGMTVVIMVMQFCAAISNVATTSRQIYAFARDKGLPFSDILSKVCALMSLSSLLHFHCHCHLHCQSESSQNTGQHEAHCASERSVR